MSDREDSLSRSHSRSVSSHKSASPKRSNSRPRSISKKRSRSASKSPVRRSRSGSYRHETRSRSRERKRTRSRSRSHRRRTRSRSRSYDRRRSTKYDRYERSSRSSYQHDRERSPLSDRRRHQGDRVSKNTDNPRKSRCLGVFGLSLRTQERDLRDIFERYGPIDDLQIVYDHQTGRSRGFGFVYFKYQEDAIDAKEQATGVNLDGRNIRIDYSITERAHTPTPGVYLGRTAGAGMRYGRGSPSPYRGGATRYSRSRSRSRSNSRRRY